ncbi:hypothetical protein [Zooshikella ganghwensis]|uniref:hypothetical protein n=1 Tax=Zooshikella ganghwensis TaxID=202772 RepID=UPI00041D4D0E|nr:hypothetical protein [Zooshikella ganghwensis]
MTSKYLQQHQLNTLKKMGDILIPGDNSLPNFSSTGCLSQIDTVLQATHPDDVNALRKLLTVLCIMPKQVLHILLPGILKLAKLPGILGTPFRQFEFATKGLLMSLYYSGLSTDFNEYSSVHSKIGYQVSPPRPIETPLNVKRQEG